MRDDQKTKADLLQKLSTLRERVSELKQAEETLKHSEEQFKELLENTTVGAYRTTPDGRIIMANPPLVRMLGYSSFEEFSQRNLEKEGCAPQYPRSIFKDLIEREGIVIGLESAWLRRDGTTLFITENARVIRDESGKTLYYEGIVQDITERKKAEDKIKQVAEEWYRTFDAISDLVFVQDKDFKIVKVNKSFCDVLKVKPEDLIGKKCYEVLHKSDKPWPNCPLAKTLKDKRPHQEELYDPNIGIPLLINTSPLFDENGELTGAVHIAKDITKRKKAEETLKREKERAEQYLDTAEVGITIVNSDENISMINRKGCEILDYKGEELIGKNWFDILVPQRIRNEIRGVFRKLMAGDIKPVEYYENPLLTKDGDERLFAFHNAVIRDHDGKVTGTLCSAEDITEHKRTEEVLWESEDRLRVALSSAQMGTWRWDPVTNQDTRDASLNLILGLEAIESTQPVEDFLHFVHPEDRDMVDEEIQRAIREHRTYVAEFRIIRPDGTVRWLRDQGKPLCDENDRVLCLTGAVIDITERKKVEEKLHKSEQRYRSLTDDVLNSSRVGIFILDDSFKIVWVNQALERYFGLRKEDVIGKDKRQLVHKQIKDIFEEPETFVEKVLATYDNNTYIENFECHVLADGQREDRWLEHWSQPIHSGLYAGGRIEHYTDITDRKKAAVVLQKSEQKYRGLSESLNELVYRADPKTFLATYVNVAVERLFGYSVEEWLMDSNLWENSLHPDDKERVLTELTEAQRKLKSDVIEYRIINKNAEVRWVENHISWEKDNEGKVVSVNGVTYDITERKKAEERQALRFEISKIFHSQKSLKNICKKIVSLIKEYLDYEVVALRMKEGDDYPYFVSNGFSQKFINSENYLCIYDEKGDCLRDSRGHLVLACMCGIVINAKFNQDRPFFTKEGSFWTNSTSDLLASTTAEDRGATTRNVCNQYGYESVALIPIKVSGDNIGLLQINDKRRNLFSLGSIQYLEELGHMMGIAIESKKTEEALRESEQKYRTLVESAGESIATINEGAVFLFINRTGAKRFGGKPKDYIGKTMWDLFPKKIADQQAAGVRKVINTGKERNVVTLTELQGQSRWYNTTIEPLMDSDGKVTAVMIIARDIHELKQAEEELNKYRAHMARAEQLASVGTLSATLAHELTQPLTVISLSIENSLGELEKTSCPDTVVKDLKEGLSEISSMTSIVNRFRNFAKISTKRTVSKVDLKAVAERIAKLLDESAWRAKVTLQVEGMDRLPCISSYEKELERLFYSLVENAIQAADGKKSRQVIISGDVRDEHIELQLSDNCGGIAPENLERIFEPFFTTKPAGERTGLGLCVVERIVSQLGSKIRVESKLGKGSTFFVTLPIKGDER